MCADGSDLGSRALMMQARSLGTPVASDHLWSIVLGASHDKDKSGVPLQYVAPLGLRGRLRSAIDRAGAWCPPKRTVLIVARDHEAWWRREPRVFSGPNTIFQPFDRGDAADLLLGALFIGKLDRSATILVVSAEESIQRERSMDKTIARAIEAAIHNPGVVVTIGVEPFRARSEHRWIVPDGAIGPFGCHAVESVRWIDDRTQERTLIRHGGLWATKMLVASVTGLIALLRAGAPRMVALFSAYVEGARSPVLPQSIDELYGALGQPEDYFAVLHTTAHRLHVIRAAECGWRTFRTGEGDLGSDRIGRDGDLARRW
jgi:mannose-1-phosphate guanylyltransferase